MHSLVNRHARACTAFLPSAACAGLVAITTALGAGSPAAQGLPDLIVSDITSLEGCVVAVTLKNQGPGALPPLPAGATEGYEVQYLKDGVPLGSVRLSPSVVGVLRPAGGTFAEVIGPFDFDVEITATVDSAHEVAEANETNNTTTKRVSCWMPDIAITGIRFSPPSCAPILTIANRGNGPMPDKAYNEGHLARIFDGAHLGDEYGPRLMDLDPKRALQPGGGTLEWTDPTEFRAVKSIRYEIQNLNFRQRDSVLDDKMETVVPPQCLPDVVVDDMTTDANCDILVSLRNAGPGPLPSKPLGFTNEHDVALPGLQFWIWTGNTRQAFGGWTLSNSEAASLRLPGGTVTFTKKAFNPNASVHGIVQVSVDAFGHYQEARTDNNSFQKALNCGAGGPVAQAPRPDETVEVARRPAALPGTTDVARRPTPLPGIQTPGTSAPLAIRKVLWTRDCRAVLTIANASGGPLADGLYGRRGARLERSVGGTVQSTTLLAAIDPARALKPAGGVLEWTDPAVFTSPGAVRWELKGPGYGVVFAAGRTEYVPAACAKRLFPKR